MEPRVDFAYGHNLVDASTSGDQLLCVQGDGLVSVRRDLEAEQAAISHLQTSLQDLTSDPIDFSAAGACVDLGRIDDIQQYGVILERLAALQAAGWAVTEGGTRPRQVLNAAAPVELTVQDGDSPDWFAVQMGVDVDGERIDLAPVLTAALKLPELGLMQPNWEKLGPRVFLPLDDNRVIALPRERLQTLLTVMRELLTQQGLGLGYAMELTRLLDTGDCKLRGQAFMIDLARRLRACNGAVDQPPPQGLQAQLRPYQRHGLNWMAFYGSTTWAGCWPMTWASAKRCRRWRICCPSRSAA